MTEIWIRKKSKNAITLYIAYELAFSTPPHVFPSNDKVG
jgi:hypothetical protein